MIRWGIHARDVLLLLALTGAVVAVTVAVFLVQLGRVTLASAEGEAELLSQQVFALSKEVLSRPTTAPPADALAAAPELEALLAAQVGYSRHVVYARITLVPGEVVVASDGTGDDGGLPDREAPPALDELVEGNPFERLRGLWGHDLYEVRRPLELDDEPFGTIRLGVATALLREEVESALVQGGKTGLFALLLSLGVGLLLAGSTVRPIRRLRNQLQRMQAGDLGPDPTPGLGGEFEALATDLHAFGRQVRADRLRLLAEKTSLETLVSHLEDPVLLLNTKREVLFANRACEEILGQPAGEALGCPVHEVLPPEHPLAQLVDRAAGEQRPVRNVRLLVPRAADAQSEFLGSAFPVADQEGAEAGFVVLLKDLEAVEMVSSLVRYGARMTALKRLATGMVHELKNPLNSMSLHVELLTQVLEGPPPEAERSLRVLGGEIRRLDRLIEDFRQFSRPEELKLRVLDVRDLLEELAHLVRPEVEASGIELELKLPDDPLEIDGDPERLRQALLNVVRNAQQATTDGGRITLAAAFEPPLFARLSVRDTGAGIPPHELERVFELYYSTKAGGTGVGLFMVHRIVQEHGGIVSAASEPGEGTEIVFHLPLHGVLEVALGEAPSPGTEGS